MKLGHIELFVQDPEESRQFYEDTLGFEVTSVQAEGRVVWVKLGETEILLRPGPGAPAAAQYQSAAAGLTLYTDDLDATVERLESKGLALAGLDGSDRCLTFQDPDGNWFQLVDPSDHE